MLRSTVSTTAIKAPSESQIRVFSFISALFAHKKNQREEIGEISSKLVCALRHSITKLYITLGYDFDQRAMHRSSGGDGLKSKSAHSCAPCSGALLFF